MRISTVVLPARAVAMAISLAAVSSGASAEVAQTAEGHFRCSAGDGMFEQAEIGNWKQSTALSGRVRFVAGIANSEWPGSGAIVFELEEGGTTGAFLMQSPKSPDQLSVIIKLPGVGNSEWLSDVPRDGWVNLAVSLDEKGLLTVTQGENSRIIPIEKSKVLARKIHCQSGTFEFDVSAG